MALNVVISKGSYEVTIHTIEVNDNIENNITILTLLRSTSSQSSGAKGSIAVDLLRITHQFTVTGYIVSKSEKEDTLSIINGGGINGGTMTLNYDGDE